MQIYIYIYTDIYKYRKNGLTFKICVGRASNELHVGRAYRASQSEDSNMMIQERKFEALGCRDFGFRCEFAE